MGNYIYTYMIVQAKAYATDKLRNAHDKAIGTFGEGLVSPVMNSGSEYGVSAFMVMTEGSKHGSDTYIEFTGKRKQYASWIDAQAYADGSNPLWYVMPEMSEETYGVVNNDNCITQLIDIQ